MLSATHTALVYGSVQMMVLVYMILPTVDLPIVMMLVLDAMVGCGLPVTFIVLI